MINTGKNSKGSGTGSKIQAANISRRKFNVMAGALGGAALLPPALLAASRSARAATVKRGGTLRIVTTKDVEVLDPSNIVSDVELRVCEQLYNGLVSIDENLNIIPDVAEEWAVSDDATVYEFKLRRGVVFHHGRELNSEDVAFTINRFKDTWVSYVVRDLDRIETPDSQTVRITFKAPAAHFLGSMAPRWTGMVPKDIVTERGADGFKLNPVGTGAFRFGEHVPFQRLVLERHADYFMEGLPYVDQLVWIPVQDETSRSIQIMSGSADVDLWAPLKLLASFRDAKGVSLIGGSTSRFEFAELNNARAPFDKLEVRRAVSMATDRQEIVDLALLGEGEPLFGGPIGPTGHPFYSGLETYKTPNLDKARALMKAAGYGDGVEVQGIAEGGSRFADAMEILQQQWAQIGVKIAITALEAGAARARRKEGDYDMTIQGWGTLVDPHDFTGEQFYTSGGLNYGKGGDAKLDALLDRGVQETDYEKRREIYTEVERYLLEDSIPYVFLYRPHEYAAFRDSAKGLKHEAGRTRISLQETWLDA